jgi:hypothetical protein
MVEMNIWVTLTADDHLWFSHSLLYFVELSRHFIMLQDVGNPLISQPNGSPKTIL